MIVDFVVLVISTTLEKLFLCSLYEVGSLVTCPGPEPDPPIWKIYDGVCKQDRTVFLSAGSTSSERGSSSQRGSSCTRCRQHVH